MRTHGSFAPRLGGVLVGSAFVVLALVGCTSSGSGTGNAYGSAGSASPAAPSAAPKTTSATELAVAKTTLGTVVVNGKGLTAYFFDNDKAGTTKSSCTGSCAATWPAITSATTTPTVSGVTGMVSTIPAVAGGNQVTIDGRPIYTFANDSAKGDVKGEGIGGVWWAVSASGAPIKQ